MSSLAFEGGRASGFRFFNPFAKAPEAVADEEQREPVRLRNRSRGLAAIRPIGLMFGAISLLAAAAWLLPTNAPREEAPAAPPANPWVEIIKPMPFFALSGSEFGKEPTRYEARRNRFGGGRIDTLTFGQFETAQKPYLRVSLYRPGTEDVERSTFFVDMARHAAGSHLAIARSAAPDTLATRFGEFETADVTLAGMNDETPCVGFRFSAGQPDLLVTGVACGTRERPVDRAILFCTIDRLDLVAAAEDRRLASFFAAAESARGRGCQQSRLTAAAARDNWLDAAGKQPPLRASLQQAATKTKR